MSVEMEVNNEFGRETGQSDLTLVVEDHKIPVSKSVLCIASPVFRAMLEGDYQERSMNEIPLPGKSCEDFVEFLRCIYPDKLKKVTEKNVYQVVPLAHEYQVKKIGKRCEKVLIQIVRTKHMNDVMELYRHIQLSETFVLADLKQTCIYLASEHKLIQFKTAREKYQISDASHYRIIEIALQRRELDSEDDKHLSLNTEGMNTGGFSIGKASYHHSISGFSLGGAPNHDTVKFILTGHIKEKNCEAKEMLRDLRLSKRYNITDFNIRSKIIKTLKGMKPQADSNDEFREEFSLLPEGIKLAVQSD